MTVNVMKKEFFLIHLSKSCLTTLLTRFLDAKVVKQESLIQLDIKLGTMASEIAIRVKIQHMLVKYSPPADLILVYKIPRFSNNEKSGLITLKDLHCYLHQLNVTICYI
jgi:hypothetical protein